MFLFIYTFQDARLLEIGTAPRLWCIWWARFFGGVVQRRESWRGHLNWFYTFSKKSLEELLRCRSSAKLRKLLCRITAVRKSHKNHRNNSQKPQKEHPVVPEENSLRNSKSKHLERILGETHVETQEESLTNLQEFKKELQEDFCKKLHKNLKKELR